MMSNTGGPVHTGEMKKSGGLIHTAQRQAKRAANTGKLISAHYLEIEYLLDRVERSTTHYQTLGLERSATEDDIILAYQQTVSVLHPSYYKVRAAVPDEMLVRIDQTFARVSEAFSTLTHRAKRVEYDRTLHRPTYIPLPLDIPTPSKVTDQFRTAPLVEGGGAEQERPAGEIKIREARAQEAISIKVSGSLRPKHTKARKDEEVVNRRRCERFKISVPALVAGYDQKNGKWQEITKTIDVSRMGVALKMKRRVRPGSVVHVTLPLPTKLRSHGFSEPGYNMYAMVRRVEPREGDVRVVGLEFIGAHPPNGYLHKPWATFRTEKWNGLDRRREPREPRAEPVVIEYLNEKQERLGHELAVTENVSLSGACVCLKSPAPEFEIVRIITSDGGFQTTAFVRNQYVGKDGFERLCLQFIEKKWPL